MDENDMHHADPQSNIAAVAHAIGNHPEAVVPEGAQMSPADILTALACACTIIILRSGADYETGMKMVETLSDVMVTNYKMNAMDAQANQDEAGSA